MESVRGTHPTVYSVKMSASLVGDVILNPDVVTGGCYYPTQKTRERLARMWRDRTSWGIGAVSEDIAGEILNGGSVRFERKWWRLPCEPIGEFFGPSGGWRPKRGIRSDDLVAIVRAAERKLLFIVEVKGSTLRNGISRTVEAKIFYQVPRTLTQLRANLSGSGMRIGGAISVVIDHYEGEIVVNVLPLDANLLGDTPDDLLNQMYPPRKRRPRG